MSKSKKPSAREAAARAFIESVSRDGVGEFELRSTRGVAGRVASLVWRGVVVERAGGGGYCKDSTVIARALCGLAWTEQGRARISGMEGCGVEPVKAALWACGWSLSPLAPRARSEWWRVQRLGGAVVAPAGVLAAVEACRLLEAERAKFQAGARDGATAGGVSIAMNAARYALNLLDGGDRAGAVSS